MSQAKSGGVGCLAFAVCGLAAAVGIGWFVIKVTQLFVPAGNALASYFAIIAGVDTLAITAVAYVAYSNPTASKDHNTAFRVCMTFATLGAMCGHGYGLAWLCGVAAVNAMLGLVVWWALVYRTKSDKS